MKYSTRDFFKLLNPELENILTFEISENFVSRKQIEIEDIDSLLSSQSTNSALYFALHNINSSKDPVDRICCLFADFDSSGGLERSLSSDLPPHIIVESGNSRGYTTYHAYWLLEDDAVSPQDYKIRQKQLAQKMNSDPCVSDLARKVRIPGSINHKKGGKFLTRIERLNHYEPKYNKEDISRWLGVCVRYEMQQNGDKETVIGGSVDIERFRLLLKQEQGISEGGRNHRIYQLACKARDFGLLEPQSLNMLSAWNLEKCSPPLKEEEIRSACKNAYKYASSSMGNNSLDSLFDKQDDKQDVNKNEEESVLITDPFPDPEYTLREYNYCAEKLLRNLWGNKISWFADNWIIWDNFWSYQDEDLIRREIRLELGKVDGGGRLKTSELKNYLDAMREIIKSRGVNKLDCYANDRNSTDHLAVKNGILTLNPAQDKIELIGYTPNLLNFGVSNCDYDPSTTCSRWEQFLYEIWGPENDENENAWNDFEEKKSMLQRFFGFCLCSDYPMQKAGMFIGSARAGKSTIATILREIIGDSRVFSCPFDMFSERFGLEGIEKARLAILNECDERGDNGTAIARIKSISGQDKLRYDRKNRTTIEIEPKCKILMIGNDVPSYVDSQGAFAKRLVLFNFNRSFEGINQDPNLLKDLRKELSGILNWAIKGYLEVRAGQVLRTPYSFQWFVDSLAQEKDSIGGFFSEFCEVTGSSSDSYQVKELYDLYRDYCISEGKHAKNKIAFSRVLRTTFGGKDMIEFPKVRGFLSIRGVRCRYSVDNVF